VRPVSFRLYRRYEECYIREQSRLMPNGLNVFLRI
jgi:hypothetical protein